MKKHSQSSIMLKTINRANNKQIRISAVINFDADCLLGTYIDFVGCTYSLMQWTRFNLIKQACIVIGPKLLLTTFYYNEQIKPNVILWLFRDAE